MHLIQSRRNEPSTLNNPLNKDIRFVAFFNVVILIIALIAYADNDLGYFLGAGLAFLFTLLAISDPKTAIFRLFGVKMTYDLLWFVLPPESLPIPLKLTELFFLPFVMCLILGVLRERIVTRGAIAVGITFAIWCGLAQILNSYGRDNYTHLIRTSGPVIGLLVGMAFIAAKEDFNTICKLVLLSTVAPILAGVTQIVMNSFGVQIFFFTEGSVRGARYAGLNHDAGGLGLAALVGILCAVYLLYAGALRVAVARSLYFFIGLAFFIVLIGGTRSVVLTTGSVLAAFIALEMGKGWKLLPFVALALWFGQPYIEKMSERSLSEIRVSTRTRQFDVSKVLIDTRYSGLMTGRMGLWQRVYDVHLSASPTQQIFGTGRLFDAHSTYFFLLVYIGKAGLLTFILFNGLLLRAIWVSGADNQLRFASLIGLSVFLAMGLALTTVSYTTIQWMLYLFVGATIRIGYEESFRKPCEPSPVFLKAQRA